MSKEEYKTIRKKFIRKRKLKRKKESKGHYILENWVPEDLTGYPDFPDYLDGSTHEEYAIKVENYWIERSRTRN